MIACTAGRDEATCALLEGGSPAAKKNHRGGRVDRPSLAEADFGTPPRSFGRRVGRRRPKPEEKPSWGQAYQSSVDFMGCPRQPQLPPLTPVEERPSLTRTACHSDRSGSWGVARAGEHPSRSRGNHSDVNSLCSCHLTRVIVTAFLLLGVAGCATEPKKEPLKFSGFLSDYSGLRPDPDGTAAWIYRKPHRNLKPYTKLMIDPLVIWYHPESEYKGINSAEIWRLALAFHERTAKALEGGYTVVDRPGPGVLRVRAALTDVVVRRPGLTAPGPIVPLLGDLVIISSETVSHTNLFVGEAAIEAELLDSQSGERLGAYVERRESSKSYATDQPTAFGPILEIFDFWAKKLRRRLDQERGVGGFSTGSQPTTSTN